MYCGISHSMLIDFSGDAIMANSTAAEHKNAKAAKNPPQAILCKVLRIPILLNSGYTKISKTGTNATTKNELIVCI